MTLRLIAESSTIELPLQCSSMWYFREHPTTCSMESIETTHGELGITRMWPHITLQYIYTQTPTCAPTLIIFPMYVRRWLRLIDVSHSIYGRKHLSVVEPRTSTPKTNSIPTYPITSKIGQTATRVPNLSSTKWDDPLPVTPWIDARWCVRSTSTMENGCLWCKIKRKTE